MASFTKGQRVRFTNGSRFQGKLGTVERVLPKNIDVRTDEGGIVRANPYFLTADLDAPVTTPAVVTEFALPLPIGTFVKYTGPRDPRLDGVWVVVGDSRDKTRIAKPGGDSGRYWRIPNGQLTEVKVNVVEVAP